MFVSFVWICCFCLQLIVFLWIYIILIVVVTIELFVFVYSVNYLQKINCNKNKNSCWIVYALIMNFNNFEIISRKMFKLTSQNCDVICLFCVVVFFIVIIAYIYIYIYVYIYIYILLYVISQDCGKSVTIQVIWLCVCLEISVQIGLFL